MGAHHSLRLSLSLHLQGADVSGISDVQNPPQPSHPRKSLEPAETMPRPDSLRSELVASLWIQWKPFARRGCPVPGVDTN